MPNNTQVLPTTLKTDVPKIKFVAVVIYAPAIFQIVCVARFVAL